MRFSNNRILLLAGIVMVASALASPHTDELKKRAEGGDIIAQLALGRRYCDGDGVPQDFEEAKKWFYMAAERGNTQAVDGLNQVERLKEARQAAVREAAEQRRVAEEKLKAEQLAREAQRLAADEKSKEEERAREEQRRSAEQKRLDEEVAVSEKLRTFDERQRTQVSGGAENRKFAAAKTLDQLTADSSCWLLIKKDGHAFLDQKACLEFRKLNSEGDLVRVRRMFSEGRVYFFPDECKIEILESAPEGKLRKIRFFSAVEETTRDAFVDPGDLLPYDREVENRALVRSGVKTAEARLRWKVAKSTFGKTVKIEEGAPVFGEIDAFWECVEMGQKDEKLGNDLLIGMTSARRAFLAGPNSTARLIGYDSPQCLLAQIECMIDGRLVRGWLPGKSVGTVPDRDHHGAHQNRFAQNTRFVLGKFAYVVKDAVRRKSIGSSLLGETAEAGACFILITVAIENLGDRTATVLAHDFVLTDGLGREFRTASRAAAAILSEGIDRSFLVVELQPGIPATSLAVFEVPETAFRSGLTLVVPEKGFWSTGTAEVPISFGR